MKKKSVLVIEDNSSNAKLIKICLANGGYDVLMADDAETALKILKQTHPDVVLIDLKLSGMNGLQLSRHLKNNPQTRDIIILALTTHIWKREEKQILNAGCNGLISQPFDTRKLAEEVDSYLERA